MDLAVLVLFVLGIVFLLVAFVAAALKSDLKGTAMEIGKIFLIIFAAVFIVFLLRG